MGLTASTRSDPVVDLTNSPWTDHT